MKKIGGYKNGNCVVSIFDDGTKIRSFRDGEIPFSLFPENIDMKITNYCNRGCKFCHEKSSIEGKHADLTWTPFLDSLKPYTELAIGGGSAIQHPDLIPFLKKLKEKNIFANITIQQDNFIKFFYLIDKLIRKQLIRGLGISFTHYTEELKQYFEMLEVNGGTNKNIVFHIINGLTDFSEVETLSENIDNCKVLILGYKTFGRGIDVYSSRKEEIEINKEVYKNNIVYLSEKLKVLSFDNLALEQLEMKNHFTEEEWNRYYMGDEGSHTMYVDMVKKEFGQNSIAEKRFKLSDTENIIGVFRKIKEEKEN